MMRVQVHRWVAITLYKLLHGTKQHLHSGEFSSPLRYKTSHSAAKNIVYSANIGAPPLPVTSLHDLTSGTVSGMPCRGCLTLDIIGPPNALSQKHNRAVEPGDDSEPAACHDRVMQTITVMTWTGRPMLEHKRRWEEGSHLVGLKMDSVAELAVHLVRALGYGLVTLPAVEEWLSKHSEESSPSAEVRLLSVISRAFPLYVQCISVCL
jgi:hypothetical protein